MENVIIQDGVKLDDLLLGDKNVVMTQQEYWDMERTIQFLFKIDTGEKQEETFDLTQLKDKEIDEKLFKDRKNEFEFELPSKVKSPLSY